MLLHLHFQHPSLLPKTLTNDIYSPFPISIRKTFALPTPKTSKFLVRSSVPDLQILPKSAIQRIAEKLRSLGFTEETSSQATTDKPQPHKTSAGEIFVPLPNRLPNYRVGHTIDTSWSTPENPVPEPGSGTAISRYHELRSEVIREKQLLKKEVRVPTLAELTLPEDELRRLRTIGIALKKKLKVGKAGITEGIVNGIHERWRRTEVVKIVCEDLCRMNMKRTHDLLERKTGGLVVWRSGSKIILYRGAKYKYPYFVCDGDSTKEILPNDLLNKQLDDGEMEKMESSLPGTKGVKASGPSASDKTAQPRLIQGVGSPNKLRFQLPGEAQLVEEADHLLDGLGPRFTDWWGYDPLPVDADLLPAIIPGYRRPFRLLPFGVNPKLTNDEMTTLKRLGRPLPCHFALGRNRKLHGLAAAIIKLWERCEIAKIAVKRGVQNTNSELMSEELKWLTGGVLLSRDREFIVLYRGKDFLPSAVSSAIEERRRHEKRIGEFAEGDMLRNKEVGETKDQKGTLHSVSSQISSPEAVIKRTSTKLSMALEKKAKAEKLLAELEKMEIPQQPEVDKECITEEERYMLRKVGLRMKPFLLLGRRGVFDGTIENMHLHWKYRELVKIIAKERNIEAARQVAKTLEEESGGILIAVETVSKGYAIIVYRGKNYLRPTRLRPQTLLNKREAMKRSLEAQRQESLNAFSVSGDSIFYAKDRFLRFYEFSTQRDTQVIPIRRPGSTSLNQSPKTLSYSPTENAILICSDVDGGSYELYVIPKDSVGRGDHIQEAKRGSGGSAIFVARNRFAVLEKSSNQVLVKNLKNEVIKKSGLPIATDAIFYAGTGNVLCRAEDRVVIFDLQQRLVLGDLQAPFVRYVVWSNDMESVALLGKHAIIIASKKLVHQFTLHETIRVKSGAWDDNGVFIYTTLTHIKYCLPSGDSGIIRTLDVPIYITKVSGNTIFCLERDGKNKVIAIDATEYIFKLSLFRKRYDHVMSLIRSSQLCGQAMIAYLQQKGFPEVALHFVKDEKTRFNLALASGNIEIAVASAKVIDEKDHWYRLGVEALRQGNAAIVEYAYQRTKNFERLSFLYLITGNMDKLSKMLKIAEVKNDVMGQFHNALYLGDVQERIKILENVGHLPLAYITASVHGLRDVAERLAAELGDNIPSLPEGKAPCLLVPPTPVMCGGDWPLLRVMKGIFEGGLDNVGRGAIDDEEAGDGDWVEELEMVNVDGLQNGDVSEILLDGEVPEEDEEEAGWDVEDLDLPPEADTPRASVTARSSVFVAPTTGMAVSQIWTQRSSLAAEHAAAGNFDTAMRLLSRQLGIRNFAPLKSMFLDLHTGSHTHLRAFSSAPILSLAVEWGWNESASPNVRGPPALVYNFSRLEEKLKASYNATKFGKFSDALRLFLSILHTIPLIVVESRREVDEVKELIIIVKEYVLGLQMELKRRELKDNPTRQQELAAYFTNCNLQMPHLRLALQNAMTVCYKAKNFATAAHFARRLLETNPTIENQAKTARQVLQAAERNMTDSSQLNYDFRNPFVICGATYVPIYRGQKDVSCPYCSSRFVPSQEGKLCTVCDLALVGADASGLLCSPSQIR